MSRCRAGAQRFDCRGKLLLWSAAGAELPLLVAAFANLVWIVAVETGHDGDAWRIAVEIVLAALVALLAAAIFLHLGLSVAYFSQARAMQMQADGLKQSLKHVKHDVG